MKIQQYLNFESVLLNIEDFKVKEVDRRYIFSVSSWSILQ